MGIPLRAIHAALQSLPEGRSPTAQDWAALSAQWRADLEHRISALTALRDELANCVGCGCLSLDSCPLISNPNT
jgi:MerR family redox-sensitive transcriptional activator SoxR